RRSSPLPPLALLRAVPRPGVILVPVFGNRNLLNLGAPFDDLHDFGVTEVALERVVGAAAVRAVDLHGVGGGADRGRRREVLRDRSGAEAAGILRVAEAAGLEAQEARGVELGDHVRHHLAHELVLLEEDAELLAAVRVRDTRFEARLENPDG